MDIAVLILAAGKSSRFSGCKLLANIDHRSMLQSRIDLGNQVLPGHVYVVSGAWHEQFLGVQATGELTGATLIRNANWSEGISSSLRAGIEFLEKKYDAALVMLADQVELAPEDLQRLLSSFNGENIACSFYQEKRGVPAIFGQNSFASIKQLHGDQGAKAMLYETSIPVMECDLPSAAVDIDTKEHLANWKTLKRFPGAI